MKLIDSKSRKSRYLLPVAFLLAACANQMAPAKQVLDEAAAAVTAAAPDAQKYMAEHYAGLQQRLKDLNSAFDQKNYDAVLAVAPGLATEARNLAQTAAAKKQDLMKTLGDQWAAMNTAVPAQIDSIKSRVDALGKAKRVPKGDDPTAAKTALDDASTLWEKAKASYATGNVEDAVASAKNAKAKVEAAAASVKGS